jgi:hypothetical protein
VAASTRHVRGVRHPSAAPRTTIATAATSPHVQRCRAPRRHPQRAAENTAQLRIAASAEHLPRRDRCNRAASRTRH